MDSNENDTNTNAEEASTDRVIDTESANVRKENDIKENENLEVEAEEASEENVDDIANVAEDENIENTEKIEETPEQRNDIEVEKDDEAATHVPQQVNVVPDLIPVHCIATVENCPDATLNKDYGDSIRRFLGSEQHLAQNIASTELQYVSSRSFRNNIFTHTVSVVIYVKTARLWESPASYIRKHLGLDKYWTRSNGTVVRLSRIHQK